MKIKLANGVTGHIIRTGNVMMFRVYDENDNHKRVEKENRIVTHEGIRMDYVLGNFRNLIYKY